MKKVGTAGLVLLLFLSFTGEVSALSVDLSTIYCPRQRNVWYDGLGIQLRHNFIKVGVFQLDYKYLEGKLIKLTLSEPVYVRDSTLVGVDFRLLRMGKTELWIGWQSLYPNWDNKREETWRWSIGRWVNKWLFIKFVAIQGKEEDIAAVSFEVSLEEVWDLVNDSKAR